ncbi:Mitochondrial import receptor subunit TOM22 -like protein [Halotydeus destructor]|nr:Mitochondrial import receptor subunit TOM22 -like protein [Halotydeus destructor]
MMNNMPVDDHIDSGVESSEMSREDSPSSMLANPVAEGDATASASTLAIEYDDEEIDETLSERLWGLTEMFPNPVRNGVGKLTYGTISSTKWLYQFSRSACWVFFTSAVVLVAPVLFEMERAQMIEMEKQQQRQILLGPGAAMSGGVPGLGAPPPPAQR